MISPFSNTGTFKVINVVLSREILFPGHLFANISSLCLVISLLIGQFGMPVATAVKAESHGREEKADEIQQPKSTSGSTPVTQE